LDSTVYDVEAKVEEAHWWFVGRRKLFSDLIKPLRIPSDSLILDVGSGTGTNLRLLRELRFTNVTGTDFNENAIKYCAKKNLGLVKKADICNLPFQDEEFDLIIASDIIEHVDDKKALSEIFRTLAPGGTALITVPAFQILWGIQDDLSHHKTRYRKKEFNALIKNAGFKISKSFYFNYLLFIPIWIVRKIIKFLKIPLESEGQINTPWINTILTNIFYIDIKMASSLQMPFGVSILSLIYKPSANR
jgi:SAM-dependent methyltransferase